MVTFQWGIRRFLSSTPATPPEMDGQYVLTDTIAIDGPVLLSTSKSVIPDFLSTFFSSLSSSLSLSFSLLHCLLRYLFRFFTVFLVTDLASSSLL